MQYTLLDMVQIILSAMDSDEVNSISDTVESNQLALLIRGVYYDLATDIGLPENETLFELTASGSASRPTLMTMPVNVIKMNWVKYDNKEDSETHKNYKPVEFMPFVQFLERQQGLREQTTGVGSMSFTQNGETFEVLYNSDRMPMYYTSTNDRQLIFDSYDATIDTTLQKSKTMCHGVVYPTFELEDTFVPDLDATQFSLLVNKAKVRAFAELKQAENREASAEARRQKIIVQKRKRSVPDIPEVYKVARFGRK